MPTSNLDPAARYQFFQDLHYFLHQEDFADLSSAAIVAASKADLQELKKYLFYALACEDKTTTKDLYDYLQKNGELNPNLATNIVKMYLLFLEKKL